MPFRGENESSRQKINLLVVISQGTNTFKTKKSGWIKHLSISPMFLRLDFFRGEVLERFVSYCFVSFITGAHQMEPPSPLISWVNPFPSRFINRTASFPRKVSYFRESRVSPWKNKIGWSRTQKPVLRPFSFFPLRPFLQFYSRWDLGIMK